MLVYCFALFLCWFEVTVKKLIHSCRQSLLQSFNHSVCQSVICSVIYSIYLQSICKYVVSYLPVQLLIWYCGITAIATAIKHRSYLCSMSNQIDVIATMPGEPYSKTAGGLVSLRWTGKVYESRILWGRTPQISYKSMISWASEIGVYIYMYISVCQSATDLILWIDAVQIHIFFLDLYSCLIV